VFTKGIVWNVSRWGQAKWSDKASPYPLIFDALKAYKGRKNFGNEVDALIATTCILHDYLLVTADGPLQEIAEAHGARTINLSDKGSKPFVKPRL